MDPKLNRIKGSYYANLIGMLIWEFYSLILDIKLRVALMSQYLVMPRAGPLR